MVVATVAFLAASRYFCHWLVQKLDAAAPVVPDYYPLWVLGSLLALLPQVIAFVLRKRFWKSGPMAGAVQ